MMEQLPVTTVLP